MSLTTKSCHQYSFNGHAYGQPREEVTKKNESNILRKALSGFVQSDLRSFNLAEQKDRVGLKPKRGKDGNLF